MAPPVQAEQPARSAIEDTAALGSFLDGVMRAHMAELDIPAAAIVVVKDDRILYLKGYGHANLELGTRVDPATSLFHIGSTGKLFTWTAVMQLVEQGKLDLDTDVNHYLKTFQLPNTFPEPITLRHLMTHTAGFQEGFIGYYVGNDSAHIRSIEETLRYHIPARVRPPGQLASYSNYGAALAGLIIEQVSGEQFAEYIERHIYEPLGIRYATFREPLPAALRSHAVIGYARENGAFVPKPFEIDGGFVPAGGTVMSAGDMARFMIAHLNDGRYGAASILRPETARLMHTRAFAHDPRLPGMALGFIEDQVNGTHVIGHDGDSPYFHVEMFLVPAQKVGLFVAYQGDGGVRAREGLKRVFFDRYFPESDTTPPQAAAQSSATKYAGSYRFIRMNYTDLDKVLFLFALQPINVSVRPGNRLLVTGGLEPDWAPAQFASVGENLFRQVDGPMRLAFREDSSGRVTRLFSSPTVATERVPWYEAPSLWYPILAAAGMVLLSVLIGFVYRRGDIKAMPVHERRAALLSVATASWLFLAVIAAVAVVAAYQMSILERVPFPLKIILAMPLVFVGLTAMMIVTSVRVWRRRYWTLGRRIHFGLVTLAACSLVWFFYQWNVLGWQFG
ncbi:MAG: serine hydrolase domain-containing protein [Gemmatimonadota bacterium]